MIRLVPDVSLDHFQFISNGSVQGAKMVLLSKLVLDEAEAIASKMTSATSLSNRRTILPLFVLGKSAVNRMLSGLAIAPILLAT